MHWPPRILRDHDLAEDALQDAPISAWRQLPALRDPDRFEAWVRKVLVHACHAEARRRRSWAANVRVLPVDGPAGPDETLPSDDRDALERAFRRPSVEHRAVFVLHHHQGLSLVEIAESLGIPAGTTNKTGALLWVPGGGNQDGFWNGELDTPGTIVVTEVDGATLAFESVLIEPNGDVSTDFDLLDTVRFVDALPELPSS